MTRKFARNPLEELFEGIERLQRDVDDLTNNKEKTLPFRDANQLPPGVEGQVVLAEPADPIPSFIVQDEGTDLAIENAINFKGAGVSAVDDPANDRTDISISSLIIPSFVNQFEQLVGLTSVPGSSVQTVSLAHTNGNTLCATYGTSPTLLREGLYCITATFLLNTTLNVGKFSQCTVQTNSPQMVSFDTKIQGSITSSSKLQCNTSITSYFQSTDYFQAQCQHNDTGTFNYTTNVWIFPLFVL